MGQAVAVGALCSDALAVAVAWANPGRDDRSMLAIDTERGVAHCGEALDAPGGFVAIGTEAEAGAEIPMAELVSSRSVDGCAGAQTIEPGRRTADGR